MNAIKLQFISVFVIMRERRRLNLLVANYKQKKSSGFPKVE